MSGVGEGVMTRSRIKLYGEMLSDIVPTMEERKATAAMVEDTLRQLGEVPPEPEVASQAFTDLVRQLSGRR